MGEVKGYPAGTFCWVDLVTSDLGQAQTFYGGLFGWTFEDGIDYAGDAPSMVARLDGHDICGLTQASSGSPTWRSWISVDDLDGTIERARSGGAELAVQPADIPDAGRSATLRDPVGASFGLWLDGGRGGATLVNEFGAWSWNELTTAEPERSAAFYGSLFGWRAESPPSPIPRLTLTHDRLLVGGIHAPQPGEGDEPGWGVGFRVSDVDQGVAQAERLGGRVYLPAMDIPIGRFAIIGDPQGTALTLSSFAASFRSVDGA